MKQNIELKTRFADHAKAIRVLRAMGAVEQPAMRQVDTYFQVSMGRLKLREMADRAELIGYRREDRSKTRRSDYVVAILSDPRSVRAALEATLGIAVVVKKRRRWFLWKNVRVHLDSVKNLGRFVEFEAVLGKGESEAEGHRRIAFLCEKLGINKAQHLAGSYADMLGKQKKRRATGR